MTKLLTLTELIPLILSIWRIGLHFAVTRIKRHPAVWPVWFANDIAWVTYAVWSKQYGFILGSVVIGAIHARAWTVWRAHQRRRLEYSKRLQSQPDAGDFAFESDYLGVA